jgi:alpha-glucosidase
MYRRALALRGEHFTADEAFAWVDVDGDGDALAFRRGSGAICVVNFGDRPVALPEGEVLIASTDLAADAAARMLPGNAAVWLLP